MPRYAVDTALEAKLAATPCADPACCGTARKANACRTLAVSRSNCGRVSPICGFWCHQKDCFSRGRSLVRSQVRPWLDKRSCAAPRQRGTAAWSEWSVTDQLEGDSVPDVPTSAIVSAAKAASKIRPWITVKRHDRLVSQEHEDLITWARDDLREEAEALQRLRNELAARGMLQSGELGSGLQRTRDTFARRWRDRKRASDRRLAELREAEGATVRMWRKLRRRPWPTDPNAEELAAITVAWEDEERRRQAVLNEVERIG